MTTPSIAQKSPISRVLPYAMAGLLVVELVVFSLLAPTVFATPTNFLVVLTNQVVPGILTLAILVPLIAGEFDASLAAVLTVSCLISAWTMSNLGWSLPVAIVVSLALSALIGALNGLVVVVFKVSSLVATLGMFTILTALISGLAGGRTIGENLPTGALAALSEPKPLGIPLPIYYLLAVALLVWYLTERTPVGRYWRAIGSSDASARMSGLRTNRLRMLAFIVGGFLAGLAGTVQLFKAQLGTPNIGPNLLFPALAAAFLGAAAFKLGSFNVWGALLAVLLVQFGTTGLIIIGAPYWLDQVFSGLILVISLVLVRNTRPRQS